MRLRKVFHAGIARQCGCLIDVNVVYLVEGSCRDGLPMGRRAGLLRREVVSSHLTAYANGCGRHGNVE